MSLKYDQIASCRVVQCHVNLCRSSVRSFFVWFSSYRLIVFPSYHPPLPSLLVSSPPLLFLPSICFSFPFISFFVHHLLLFFYFLVLIIFPLSLFLPLPLPQLQTYNGALFSNHFIPISFCSIYYLSVFASKLFFTYTFPTFVLPFSFSFCFFSSPIFIFRHYEFHHIH